jgi:hypothetical protein
MNSDLQTILAEQLRDLALPAAVHWWPLAFGWWVLIVLLSATLIGLSYLLIKHYRRNRYRKVALQQLQLALETWRDEPDPSLYLRHSNQTLKRIFVSLGEQTGAAEHGEEWIKRLVVRAKQPLSEFTVRALTLECYKATPKVAIEQLHAELTQWVRSHRRHVNVSQTNV